MALADYDPLRSRLNEVENEMRGRLHLVCKTPPPEDLDTGAMIRFEEELSIVTSAAKEAVSLKRRLRVDRTSEIVEPRGGGERAPGQIEARD